MSTSTDICNMALVRLGQARISSLSESGKAAQLCNLFFEPTRDELLSGFSWSFAIERAILAADAGTNLTEFDYKYILPTNFLRMLTQISSDDYSEITDEWTIEGNYLLSDLSPNYIKYIKKITNSADLPQAVVKALSLSLASQMCISLTQDQALCNKIAAEYAGAYVLATANDGGYQKSDGAAETLWSD